eukprot:TRINITY_DN1971_c0_g1_i1.p1 TRINITY_DN1971_c0_g1~~TRINITY_DN1971_c0_g1_i1.p1  ORF type:complete len:419 (+),score=154.05 TRINITY_DN1971_c0_g1_i1:66-1259(+)
MATTVDHFNTGHQDMIHDAQYDYYGRCLATCSSDGQVHVFGPGQDQQPPQVVAELKEHAGPVWSVAWGHPRFGTMLASGGYDGKVCVWQDKQQGQPWGKVYEYMGHKSSVNKVEWAPHQHGLAALACGSSDSSLSVLTYDPASQAWDIKTIPDAHQLGVNTVAWEPVTTAPAHRIASGGADRLLKIWTRNEQGAYELERSLLPEGMKSYPDWVRDVAFCPASPQPFSTLACCSGNKAFVWRRHEAGEKSSYTLLATLTVPMGAWKVSWSEHGGLLAVTAANDNVYIFKNVNLANPSDWQQVAVQPVSPEQAPQPPQQHQQPAHHQQQPQQQQPPPQHQHHHHHHHHHHQQHQQPMAHQHQQQQPMGQQHFQQQPAQHYQQQPQQHHHQHYQQRPVGY